MSKTISACHCGNFKASKRENIRRNVCKDLPIWGIYEGESYCVLHYPSKSKSEGSENVFKKEDFKTAYSNKLSKNNYDFRGVWFPIEADFSGKIFKEVHPSFEYAVFSEKVTFKGAKFHVKACFYKAAFQREANFRYAEFYEDVEFERAVFLGNASFRKCNFVKEANFSHVLFDNDTRIHFRRISFNETADFGYVFVKNHLTFEGERKKDNKPNLVFDNAKSFLNLENARIEKPERILFRTVRLRPSFFIKVDPRKFGFIDIEWNNKDASRQNIKAEILSLQNINISNPLHLLTIACRQLAANAEENNRYEEASDFRRMAFETEWLEKKTELNDLIKNIETAKNPELSQYFDAIITSSENLRNRFGNENKGEKTDLLEPLKTTIYSIYKFSLEIGETTYNLLHNFVNSVYRRIFQFSYLHFFYRITSYYGESWRQAFVVLLIILTASAILYTRFHFNVCLPNEGCKIRTLNLLEAITHSISTAILQNSEVRKPQGYAELVVTLEKIFAPLQATLLALAIRRKFMR